MEKPIEAKFNDLRIGDIFTFDDKLSDAGRYMLFIDEIDDEPYPRKYKYLEINTQDGRILHTIGNQVWRRVNIHPEKFMNVEDWC